MISLEAAWTPPGKLESLPYFPGATAKPADIRFTDTLPKTRAGKIISRLLRELAAGGKVSGDTTTPEDFRC